MSQELNIAVCPFCGSEADLQSDFGREHWVQCENLDCGATNGQEYKHPAEAIEAWNRRATPPAAQQASAPAGAADLHQFRTKPDWDDRHPWSNWQDCTPEAFADYQRMPRLHDWTYEVRALYAAPLPQESGHTDLTAACPRGCTGPEAGGSGCAAVTGDCSMDALATQPSAPQGELAKLREAVKIGGTLVELGNIDGGSKIGACIDRGDGSHFEVLGLREAEAQALECSLYKPVEMSIRAALPQDLSAEGK